MQPIVRRVASLLLLLSATACYRATHIIMEPKEPVFRTRADAVQMIAHVMTAHSEDAEAKVTWSVEDSAIAKVSADGVVSGLTSGRTNVVATYSGLVAKVPIEVKYVEKVQTPTTKVELSREKGDPFKPDITVSSYDGLPLKDRSVDFAVKDSSICQVDKQGQFWPINEGETVVTASVDHHSVDIACTVTK
jgi:hypothetical protein